MTKHMELKLADIVSLATFCETHDVNVKRGRRMARNGKFDGAFQFAGGKSWMIARDANVPEFGDARTMRTRSDGRKRYVVYMTDMERGIVENAVGVDNVVDVRKLAKQRRADKKLAERHCPVCGETGDASCFDGDGICARTNAETDVNES